MTFTLAASEQAASDTFDQAHKARSYIEKSNLPAGDQGILNSLLEAQTASLIGKPREAIDILKELSTEVDSEDYNTIIEALLAHAYLEAGDYPSYFECPVTHGTVVPETPYEKLFVGKALFWLDYQQSIDYLNEAVQQTPSPLSFLARARSSALLACSLRANTKTPGRSLELIEQAIQDLQVANHLLKARNPDSEEQFSSPEIEGMYLLVLSHAHDIYQQLGRSDDASQVLESAEEHFQSLQDLDDTRLGYIFAWKAFYLLRKAAAQRAQGEESLADSTREDAFALLKETNFRYPTLLTEVLRLQQTDPQAAEVLRIDSLKELEEKSREELEGQHKYHYQTLFYLLDPDPESGREHAIHLLESVDDELSITEALWIGQGYTFLGDLKGCREFAKQQLENEEFWQYPYGIEGLRYFAGELNRDDYLKKGEGSGAETYRIFITSMTELAKGDRTAAEAGFERARAEGVFHSWGYEISAAILERMEADDTWPPWLTSSNVNPED